MNLLQRLSTTLSAKANELLDRYDDPREALDYTYQRLFEQLGRARQAAGHLATAQQRLVLQSAQLERCGAELETEARAAASRGRDDLAREALARRAVITVGVTSLFAEGAELADEDERFSDAAQLLESKVEELRVRKESLKASYAVTGDKAEIDRAITEIRTDVASVTVAVQRAEDRVAQLRAQAEKIDALLASGAFQDLASTPESIDTELREARGSEEVERELATIKRAPPTGTASV